MIPKIIWQTYKTKYEDLPQYAKNATESWKKMNPGYTYNYMSDEDASKFVLDYYGDNMLKLFNQFPLGVMRADLWRYLIIYAYGGIYTDLDTVCEKPIDTWLNPDCELIVCPEFETNYYCQWTFAGQKNSKILKSVIDLLIERNKKPDYSNEHFVHYFTGPSVWTDGIRRSLEIENENFDICKENRNLSCLKFKCFTGELAPMFHWISSKHLYASTNWLEKDYENWHLQRQRYLSSSTNIFNNIYEKKIWDSNGLSGPGSTIEFNKDYITFLKKFISERKYTSIIDLGCGDFRTGKSIYDELNVKYFGYDCYEKIIDMHTSNADFDKTKYNFYCLDFIEEPNKIISGDLCIIKDVLQHHTLEMINEFLEYLIASKKYKCILICNCKDERDNIQIKTGDFRGLSANSRPLSRFKPKICFEYCTKEVSLIEFSPFVTYFCGEKIRLGNNDGDGGYVISRIDSSYDCYISAGVSNEESFTRDFLDTYNIDKKDCYAFDGTIESYPYEYTTNINFVKKNIGSKNTDTTTNLSFLAQKYNNIFLKMDIEGSEYEWLRSFTHFERIKQMTIEFHYISENLDQISEILQKLSKTHYIIHVHANNYCQSKTIIPEVLEITFLHSKCMKNFKLNCNPLPDKNLDRKNSLLYDEIDLNFPPFVYPI